MRNHCKIPRPHTHGGGTAVGASPEPSFPLYHIREIVAWASVGGEAWRRQEEQ